LAKRLGLEPDGSSNLAKASLAWGLFGVLYSVPLVLAGVVWLLAVTDVGLLRAEWSTLLILCAFLFLFKQLSFFFFIESPGDEQTRFNSTFEPIVVWSAVLVFGPTVIWIAVLLDAVAYGRQIRRVSSVLSRLDHFRNLLHNLAGTTLVSLLALSLYARWGGAVPFPGFTLEAILPAVLATLVHVGLQALVYVPLLFYVAAGWSPVFRQEPGWLTTLTWGLVITLGATGLIELFAIFAAGLYAENGAVVYFVFLGGLLLVSWLAHRLSTYLERSQQRSRELERLEELGRAILRAPADASTLSELLKEHAGAMFLRSRIEIRLYAERTLLHSPDNWPLVSEAAWGWLRAHPEASFFLQGANLPWGEQMDHGAGLALAPILDAEATGEARPESLGGIYLLRDHDPLDVASLLPALQSLAAQIASALHRAEVARIERELEVAGRIQASFLPGKLPEIAGWQLAAALEPARETSGDFYDVIPLPDGCFGLVIADVADKGTGAALYMALSRTLIRTFAVEYGRQPELALGAANRRILADASADLFVTVFYAVLDPVSDMLCYCNAGHNPPYLLDGQDLAKCQELTRTGLPLGVLEDETWGLHTVQLGKGSTLVMYTDGVTEAENPQMELFGKERLLETLKAVRGSPACRIRDAVLGAVHNFASGPHYLAHDDITLMVLVRAEAQL
jgi:serine phosphatase RsbU (regulator of sigma subunit)